MTPYQDPDQPAEDRVVDLINQMTIDEKIAQLGGIFPFHLLGNTGEMDGTKMRELIPHGIGQISGASMIGAKSPEDLATASNTIQRFHIEETRLGIPTIIHNEALCGMMYAPATTFPTAINLAATWQPSLVRAMTDVTRREMRGAGVHQALSPVLDVARDARWGRVHESYGEDPVLCAAFGVAFVEGLQGEDLRNGVIATAKHFVGYGLSEGALNQAAVHLGPRELYEVFALPFEAAIRQAGLMSIMNSYSEIDGVPVAASREVLTNLLRIELGFEGFVVADYRAVLNNYDKHHVARDEKDAALQALEAGLDLELPELNCFRHLATAVEEGHADVEFIDVAVSRILEAKFHLGLFDEPYCDESKVSTVYGSQSASDLAREATEQSLVLLDNDGILPLSADTQKVALVGPFANSLRLMFAGYTAVGADELGHYIAAGMSGTMAGVEIDLLDIDSIGEVIFGTRDRGIPDETIENAVRSIYPDMPTLALALSNGRGNKPTAHAVGCEVVDTSGADIDAAVAASRGADVAICAIGEKSGWVGHATGGEGRDRSSLALPGLQSDLLDAIIASGTPTVVILFGGRPLAIDRQANATIWAGCPGLHGPKAIADALIGTLNPSGKLPITFPRSAGHTPVYASHKPGSSYSEEAGHGYIDAALGPLYAFGHGVSYTKFEISDLDISETVVIADETVEISCTVANTGKVAGAEVVQVYLRDREASVTRPVKQLAGFSRCELQPGEKKRITFHVYVGQLAFLNREYRLVVEPGEIDVMVGSSSEDIQLRGGLTIDGDVVELENRGPFYARIEQGEVL